ncbi:polysaccharide deacetylase family protein, partial [bacterium]
MAFGLARSHRARHRQARLVVSGRACQGRAFYTTINAHRAFAYPASPHLCGATVSLPMPRPQLLLCYHKVGPVAQEGRWLNVDPGTLALHLEFFLRRGWGLRTASAAYRREPGTVQFHFDDAYASAVEAVPAVFARRAARATFFVVPTQIGGASVWDGDRAAPLADLESLRRAKEDGHEIANHTLTHPHLGRLSVEEQTREITEARRILLERDLLHPDGRESADAICYPWGDHDPVTTPAALTLAGAGVGFSLAKRPARPSDPDWAVPRIAVAYSDTVAGLLYKIHI